MYFVNNTNTSTLDTKYTTPLQLVNIFRLSFTHFIFYAILFEAWSNPCDVIKIYISLGMHLVNVVDQWQIIKYVFQTPSNILLSEIWWNGFGDETCIEIVGSDKTMSNTTPKTPW